MIGRKKRGKEESGYGGAPPYLFTVMASFPYLLNALLQDDLLHDVPHHATVEDLELLIQQHEGNTFVVNVVNHAGIIDG